MAISDLLKTNTTLTELNLSGYEEFLQKFNKEMNYVKTNVRTTILEMKEH